MLAVLELRISLETESAGLAATRRTEEQLLAMREALDDFERNVAEAGDTVAPDFRFHLQIAQATGNPYFADIMSHLGTTIIPRTRISAIRTHDRRGEYLSRVNREHEEIYAAIARQRSGIGPRGDAHPPDQQPRAPAPGAGSGPARGADARVRRRHGDLSAWCAMLDKRADLVVR